MNNKGMAMLIVISLILMLLILGGTVMMISTGHFSTSHHRVARTKAYYAAEAAMQYAFWALRTGNESLPLLPAGSPIEIDLPSDDQKENYFEVNGRVADDITIAVGVVNPRFGESGHDSNIPVGVSPVVITVNY